MKKVAVAIAVILFIGLIYLVSMPNVHGPVNYTDMELAERDMEILATAISLYEIEFGKIPKTSDGLEVLIEPDIEMILRIPEGPSGEPYIYEKIDSNSFRLSTIIGVEQNQYVASIEYSKYQNEFRRTAN